MKHDTVLFQNTNDIFRLPPNPRRISYEIPHWHLTSRFIGIAKRSLTHVSVPAQLSTQLQCALQHYNIAVMHTSRMYKGLDSSVGVQLQRNVGVERSSTAVPGDYVDRMATQNLVPFWTNSILLFGFSPVSCGQSRVRRIFSRMDVGFDTKCRSLMWSDSNLIRLETWRYTIIWWSAVRWRSYRGLGQWLLESCILTHLVH
jgi:hypothetical protein